MILGSSYKIKKIKQLFKIIYNQNRSLKTKLIKEIKILLKKSKKKLGYKNNRLRQSIIKKGKNLN